ncbi:MAG TPA: glycosyltransferase, partial [Acidobacteriaceae bacterium]|nr:glycosyltransferase [Acidobacteriaceae bacterium]
MSPIRKLRILYVATMHRGWYGLYRKQSLERLGHTLIPLDIERFQHVGNVLTRRVHFRMQVGEPVSEMNEAVLAMAQEHRVDLVWFDKPLWIRTPTLRRLRQMGIATVDYMIDNPFGPRNDPGFGLYIRAIPEYDLHVQQRDVSVRAYLEHGARRMVKVQTAFEPTVHFPPPPGWSDSNRTRQVSFIGTPYDQRADFLTCLWKKYGLPVIISGPPVWRRKLSREACVAIYPRDGELYDQEYRQGIWQSRINLSFLTHGNQDEYAHKSFEIAACGGFLLVERSAGHAARFQEDEEAVFFSGVEECAAKIQKYLNDEPARQRIAAAGQLRAVAGGYDNDTQMRKIFAAVEEILPTVQERAGVCDLVQSEQAQPFTADVCIVGA